MGNSADLCALDLQTLGCFLNKSGTLTCCSLCGCDKAWTQTQIHLPPCSMASLSHITYTIATYVCWLVITFNMHVMHKELCVMYDVPHHNIAYTMLTCHINIAYDVGVYTADTGRAIALPGAAALMLKRSDISHLSAVSCITDCSVVNWCCIKSLLGMDSLAHLA